MHGTGRGLHDQTYRPILSLGHQGADVGFGLGVQLIDNNNRFLGSLLVEDAQEATDKRLATYTHQGFGHANAFAE